MLFHALKVLKIFIFLTNIFALYLAIYRYQFIYLSSHISKIYKGVLAWELNVAWKRPRLKFEANMSKAIIGHTESTQLEITAIY